MSSQTQVAFNADPIKNVFSMAFVGKVGLGDLSAVESEVETAIQDLRPGFSLLTDLSTLEWMDPLCATSIDRTMELFHGHGVKLIVRIIPDPKRDIGFNIMSLFHYPRTVHIVTVTTAEEAARTLR
jgi:hypothetical protein